MTKILVADDSALAAKIQARVLEGQGYEVVIARDGIEAAQAVYAEWPDLVLLDIFMPRMNGYQVCRLLKSDPAVSNIPIVISTASHAREAEFWSLHTGADAFLLKGALPSELLVTVEQLLRDKEPHRESPSSLAIPQLGPEEILSKVCAIADRELYTTTVERVHLQTILGNLCEGILTLDRQGQVASANQFLCRLVGMTESELIGCPLPVFLGSEAGTYTHEMFVASIEGDVVEPRDSEVRDQAGRATPVSINVAPVRDYLDEIVGCVVLFQDITRRKQVESLSQLKNDLTAMIVHDLRTPLTALLTGLQSLDYMGENDELQRELLDISLAGGESLLSMINDLLDISKMEDGSMQLERRELHAQELAASAIQQVAPLAANKGLHLSHKISLDVEAVWGDENKLLRSLVNLLSNAIKFTPQNGHVTLKIESTPITNENGDGEGILISMSDTGEGIPESAYERIFEKFGQVESRREGRHSSTGLGLTFCKMAVEAHGGHIWVQSTLGQGSTFSFVLPHRSCAPPETSRPRHDRRTRCIAPWPHAERRIGPRDQRQ
ncbi:MAG TPA: ATP-binding protein [Abditibacterium sp.]|jgi:PAS domain S-box-containing protein